MPSTTTYQPGDLLLIGFPFSGGSGFKTRPAMVLLDSGDHDVVVARVTTQQHRAPYDVSLVDWQAAGLPAASTVRLHKLATLEKNLIRLRLCELQPADHVSAATGVATSGVSSNNAIIRRETSPTKIRCNMLEFKIRSSSYDVLRGRLAFRHRLRKGVGWPGALCGEKI